MTFYNRETELGTLRSAAASPCAEFIVPMGVDASGRPRCSRNSAEPTHIYFLVAQEAEYRSGRNSSLRWRSSSTNAFHESTAGMRHSSLSVRNSRQKILTASVSNLATDRRYPRHWHWCERRAKF
jgi:hypothetical protein